MNAIIDTCVIPSVFSATCQKHHEYKPIKECLYNRKLFMQIGGTKYIKELQKFNGYLRIINELIKAGIVHKVSSKNVDKYEKKVLSKENDKDFDDPHLIALQIVSKAIIICTDDARAMPFLKKKELYPKNHKRPKIYSGLRNVDLLPN